MKFENLHIFLNGKIIFTKQFLTSLITIAAQFVAFIAFFVLVIYIEIPTLPKIIILTCQTFLAIISLVFTIFTQLSNPGLLPSTSFQQFHLEKLSSKLSIPTSELRKKAFYKFLFYENNSNQLIFTRSYTQYKFCQFCRYFRPIRAVHSNYFCADRWSHCCGVMGARVGKTNYFSFILACLCLFVVLLYYFGLSIAIIVLTSFSKIDVKFNIIISVSSLLIIVSVISLGFLVYIFQKHIRVLKMGLLNEEFHIRGYSEQQLKNLRALFDLRSFWKNFLCAYKCQFEGKNYLNQMIKFNLKLINAANSEKEIQEYLYSYFGIKLVDDIAGLNDLDENTQSMIIFDIINNITESQAVTPFLISMRSIKVEENYMYVQ